MTSDTGASFVGRGVYSVAEASRLTGVSAQRIRRWLKGYEYSYKGNKRQSEAVWRPGLPEIDGVLALSFRDLIEARFVDAFRTYGVSWKVIRTASRRAAARFDLSHPFSTARFKTDGRTIFAEVVQKAGETSLLDLVKDQFAFRQILKPYLYAGIDYSPSSGEPERWWPRFHKGGIVLDPLRCFGKPIVAKEGVPTSALAAAYDAEQSYPVVARWYEVSIRSVRQAVNYEQSLAA